MCTVSVIPLKFAAPRGHEPVRGFRLVTNRDERRDRPPATPPRWREVRSGGESRRVLFPTDTAAGGEGTWVGVNQGGLVLCVLNGNPRPYPALPAAERLISRGAIVPGLLGSADADAAAGGVEGLELERFAPFSLLAVDLPPGGGAGERGPRVLRVRWDGVSLERAVYPPGPVCAVSSGLGDECVLPRLGLFDELMAADGVRPETQDRFHRHVWRDRPEISVMMSRGEARTVSVTTVEVVGAGHATPGRVAMEYRALHGRETVGGGVVIRSRVGVGVPVVAG